MILIVGVDLTTFAMEYKGKVGIGRIGVGIMTAPHSDVFAKYVCDLLCHNRKQVASDI